MALCYKNFCVNSIINFLLFTIGTVLLLLCEFGILPTHKSGFYCFDPALSFPYYDDDIVSTTTLILVSLLFPLGILVLNEFKRRYDEDGKYSTSNLTKDVHHIFVWYREYLVDLGLKLYIVQLIKFVMGKPRPSFFHGCQPDTAVNCTSRDQYISTFECTNELLSTRDTFDLSRSFLSGHASISVFTSIFLFCYIQQRCKGPWLLRPSLQFVCLAWGTVASLSRILDYRHHWWDVLAGTVLGMIFAAHCVYVLCRNFACDSETSSKPFSMALSKLDRSSGKINNMVVNNHSLQEIP